MQAVVQPDFTSSHGSLSVPGDGRSPANQAYVDLLKASWILHTMVLREENAASLMTDENRKLFQDLSDVRAYPFDACHRTDIYTGY
jgi:hypothetical protein